jgi:hypothetical protein
MCPLARSHAGKGGRLQVELVETFLGAGSQFMRLANALIDRVEGGKARRQAERIA